MGTPFRSSNSNVGKQDKLVQRGSSYMSDANGQRSASGDVAAAKRVSEGAVEAGNRSAGHVAQGSGRVVDGKQDQLRKRGADSSNRPTGF